MFDGMHYLGDLIKLYLCFIATPGLNLRACSAYFARAVFAHNCRRGASCASQGPLHVNESDVKR